MFHSTRMIALATALGGFTSIASAQEIRTGPATYAVVVHRLDRHPRSAKAARAVLDRLGEAAMEACGASSFSLREVKESVRASACWHTSMEDAITGIGDPMLRATFAQR